MTFLETARKHLLTVQGGDQAEDQLLGPFLDRQKKVSKAPGSSSGLNVTWVVVFKDAAAPNGFFKPHDGLDPITAENLGHDRSVVPLNECAAWRLAKRFGDPYRRMVAPVVYREVAGEWGSISQSRGGPPRYDDVVANAADEVLIAGFFDAVIGQQDRHDRQHRYDPAEGALFLIDHGYSFPNARQRHRNTQFWDERLRMQPDLDDKEQDLLAELAQSSDLFGIAPLLREDSAENLRLRAEKMADSGKLARPKRFIG